MRMPFGKHKGKRLEDVPVDYLVWLTNECDLKEVLRAAVEKELRSREFDQSPEPAETSLTTDIVNTWHRRMAVKFHPDKGGSHEAMKAVNAGRELLMQLMEVA